MVRSTTKTYLLLDYLLKWYKKIKDFRPSDIKIILTLINISKSLVVKLNRIVSTKGEKTTLVNRFKHKITSTKLKYVHRGVVAYVDTYFT